VSTFDNGFRGAMLGSCCMIVDLVQVESVQLLNLSENGASLRIKKRRCICKVTCDQEHNDTVQLLTPR
jgi:hypothetical protein